MHFDSGFTSTEFRRYLLIKHSGNDEAHHFALPDAQCVVSLAQLSSVSLLFADNAISSERPLNRVEQILVPEWLGEELNRTRLHGPDRHRNVGMCREKDDWNTCFPFFQFVLKVQAANAGESHIKNEATGTVTVRTRQELLCCSERLRRQADRLQQFLERLTHVSIIIDNEYGWHILRAHNHAPQAEGK
jgi:hypothetical protein